MQNIRQNSCVNEGFYFDQRTSKFSKREFSEYIEHLKATAADRGVEL